MDPRLSFRELEGVIARYLRGDVEFDTAADELAGILRSLMTAAPEPEPRRPPGPVKIKPLTAAEWMNPRVTEPPLGGVLHAVPLAPGKSAEDERRAQALFDEAARRAESTGGSAV